MVQRAISTALVVVFTGLLVAAGMPVLGQEPKLPDRNTGTHLQTGEIAIKGPGTLSHFCVAADGNIVALVGAGQNYGANVQTKGIKSEVRLYDPTGKQLKNWAVDFIGTAVSTGPDGSIWVAGNGQIARFDKDGKPAFSAESPHVAEVVKDQAKLKKQAEDTLKEEIAQYKEQVKQFEEQKKQYAARQEAKKDDKDKEKKERKPVDVEELQAQQFDQIIKSYQQMVTQLEKTTVDDKIKQIKSSLADIRCIAASEKDLFITTRMVKGYGFAVWRMTPDLKEPKQIVGGLSGCCGQMDVECCKDCVYVAENSRKRVCKYDREGKLVSTFGKDVRSEPVSGFGSCCNPMNVCFNAAGDIFTSESDGQVKRFGPDGKFIEFVGLAQVQAGCKNSAIGLSPDGSKLYYIDSQKSKIIVLDRKNGEKSKSTTAARQ